MKRVIIVFLVFFLRVVSAQSTDNASENNVFQQSEENSTQISSPDNQVESGPNGPPLDNDIPIDDYIPILALVGSLLILYSKKKRLVIPKN